MSALAHGAVEALRSVLEPLAWPDRFEEIARAYKAADPGTRDAIATLRTELADLALAELSADWNGVPFKEAILQVPEKRLRGALTRAAKAARNRFIVETVRASGPPLTPLGPGCRFGAGLDERAVEMPLALAVASLDRPGLVLDAGAALNLPLVRQVVPDPAARLTHFTLPGSKEPMLADAGGHFEYAFGDLRSMPYGDATFDRIVCVSTLEHVGMDTTRFGAASSGTGDASGAVAELIRVLAPGGTLLITVPYGRAADHGWFRVLDAAGLHSLLEPAAAHPVTRRCFYYEGGWAEGREEPPARVAESPFDGDVVTGVAIAQVIKQ